MQAHLEIDVEGLFSGFKGKRFNNRFPFNSSFECGLKDFVALYNWVILIANTKENKKMKSSKKLSKT